MAGSSGNTPWSTGPVEAVTSRGRCLTKLLNQCRRMHHRSSLVEGQPPHAALIGTATNARLNLLIVSRPAVNVTLPPTPCNGDAAAMAQTTS